MDILFRNFPKDKNDETELAVMKIIEAAEKKRYDMYGNISIGFSGLVRHGTLRTEDHHQLVRLSFKMDKESIAQDYYVGLQIAKKFKTNIEIWEKPYSSTERVSKISMTEALKLLKGNKYDEFAQNEYYRFQKNSLRSQNRSLISSIPSGDL